MVKTCCKSSSLNLCSINRTEDNCHFYRVEHFTSAVCFWAWQNEWVSASFFFSFQGYLWIMMQFITQLRADVHSCLLCLLAWAEFDHASRQGPLRPATLLINRGPAIRDHLLSIPQPWPWWRGGLWVPSPPAANKKMEGPSPLRSPQIGYNVWAPWGPLGTSLSSHSLFEFPGECHEQRRHQFRKKIT
jgi:hypothetical protein